MKNLYFKEPNSYKQGLAFFCIGITAALLDFFLYKTLLFLEFTIFVSKFISYFVIICLSYFTNKFVTFNHQKDYFVSIIKYLFLYSITLAVNVISNYLFFTLFNSFEFKLILSFILATSLSAILNFLGLKFFVFKSGL